MFAHGKGVVVDIDIWHKCIGHVNIQWLKKMKLQNIVAWLPQLKMDNMHKVCEACQLGKQANYAFPHNAEVSKRHLEVIHNDVWTTKTTSIGSYTYYVSFINDHTRKVCLYFMKQKSEVFNHFNKFRAMLEKKKGMHIKVLRSHGT